ncbi:DNA-directed RNA polymerase, beta' subunit [Acidimicrobium ferrooxidans DSM 10331]|uniref:DNA-directed RNA polymerase subunit beta' n=1 Tax=Acidimicrobium ferrooxidans (strain DSM 10331 / JCM 15462 / NBRC 103882 / ICP) TaxID=525909 RepID=C7M2W6_ACIFD|nr:DNA-directed RNA polymerase subunit beta' [Acidimicrobium ferrooxidans]ACU53360.1 DNA-directed RNA polymerase, beta' subunit [Acidimicrobium ferrooxidans DSM 10331]
MLDLGRFDQIRIGLATTEAIRAWSHGEVKKPETINYRTLRPERDGLFCERIFGPTRDWECQCGKYKRVRFRGIVCERCGVEVTRSKVRRERMGHIELAAPVVHIWYLRGTRSWLAYLLMGTSPKEELKAKQLEKVIYFAANLVTWVDEERRHQDLPNLEVEVLEEVRAIESERDVELERRYQAMEAELAELEEQGAREAEVRQRQRALEREITQLRERYAARIDLARRTFDEFRELYPRQIIEDELLWRELRSRYGSYFDGGMGAEAIADLIRRIDFDAELAKLRELIDPAEGRRPLSAQRRQKAIRRLRILAAFNQRDEEGRRINDPMAMILEVVPVIPPDLRPMVQLDGGRFATSDLNDLYRRVINRNNRLKRLLDLGAPEIIVNNEKRMLQEAVDALFDNGRRGRPVVGPGNRPLKSLSDMLKGKQGRFRQNLLGKRVDYSGRSVIVGGPTLQLHQCGLPKIMALELFKPFVMRRLVELGYAQNIKSAKRMVERRRPQVWEVLETVIKEHPVLLNRAPTLHRLGIQAFEPVLVEGKAIQIHPLVTTAFNADFDGDQMAVHLPLSPEAQAEARVLMLSANNTVSPATGRPITVPGLDMVFGLFYLTIVREEEPGAGKVFRHDYEVVRAWETGNLGLHAPITLRRRDGDGNVEELRTTAGRVMFNQALPADFPFVNEVVGKKALPIGSIVERVVTQYPRNVIEETLDRIKSVGFTFATRAGLTISTDDVTTPAAKAEILDRYEREADKAEAQYRRGIITDDERKQKEIEIWTAATAEIGRAIDEMLASNPLNPLAMMVESGARGNPQQIRQISGLKGLVANPRGEMIPRPIKSSFREGLEVLEYFLSTHGARKGLADTALRTADSGYLTRRLVDVAQELIVREEDCGTSRGIWIDDVAEDSAQRRSYLETRAFGRVLAEAVDLGDGSQLPAGTLLTDELVKQLAADPAVERIRVRTPLTCETPHGVCATCYGQGFGGRGLIELGEAVGVVAAQSIGEPGTQLTMRTFHQGGVAGADITHGLPRVVELFEARSPRGAAVLAHASGVVHIEEEENGRRVTITHDDGSDEVYVLPLRAHLEVAEGEVIEAGEAIVSGPKDPKQLLEIKGIRETQRYLVEEVQKVYRDQGVSIHDKHIELIVRQMLRRVLVAEPGDSPFLPGERVDTQRFAEVNRELFAEGKRPAEGRPELMGITKASLATESWLSAASFQETTRVLTEAAIEGRSDHLLGLKENIILGKLIPAGTGAPRYRSVAVKAPHYRRLAYWSSEEDLGGFDGGPGYEAHGGPVD